MTPDALPRCVCTAHPPGDRSGRRWMKVAEESAERVVFVCERCTEICRTAVIQVRTLPKGMARARYINELRGVERAKAPVMARLRAMQGRQAPVRLRREDAERN